MSSLLLVPYMSMRGRAKNRSERLVSCAECKKNTVLKKASVTPREKLSED